MNLDFNNDFEKHPISDIFFGLLLLIDIAILVIGFCFDLTEWGGKIFSWLESL